MVNLLQKDYNERFYITQKNNSDGEPIWISGICEWKTDLAKQKGEVEKKFKSHLSAKRLEIYNRKTHDLSLVFFFS